MAARIYRWIDGASGMLLLGMIAAAPWLFGATEVWAMNLLNAVGYTCGLLLALKWVLRWQSGAIAVDQLLASGESRLGPGRWLVRAMAVLTVAVLFFCLVSALNARATYLPFEHRFEYRRHVPWLPFTYDSDLTWRAFWNYLGLACAFWALRDWLLHPAHKHRHAAPSMLPTRFRTLLWVVAINSTVLALEGTFQRLAGAQKLLWLRPTFQGRADLMFGPYAFGENASQYFNLAWPAVLAFWWSLREEARRRTDGKAGGGPHIFLLLCATLIAAGPMIATSESGSLVLAVQLATCIFIIFLSHRGSWQSQCTIVLVCAAVLALGGALGWDQLAPRLREFFRTPYANPAEVYENARQMSLDYPLYGVGPGAFRATYHLYRADPAQAPHAFLHDDWLETRVTFGWVGSMFILCLLCLALTRWFVPGGIYGPWEFVALLWTAVGGCLADAKFSFPLQVYSVLLLLLVLLAVLSCLSRPES